MIGMAVPLFGPGNNSTETMKQKLSIPSRILIAFATGALVTVFFLPAWRIDLFAPQYPEGLTLKIWINNLSGDIDIINGLNHYIGMKPISVEMFPEFKYLPFVVGFFMVLGMFVAVSGYRRFLFLYLVLTAIGGALALYDFYRWGYDYGHHLDPKAPIQVPGLSYQPPIIGHKRLLNFDAYSFPDVAGWIVIGAGAMAFIVWFVEWFRVYRARKAGSPRFKNAVAAGLFLLPVLIGCSSGPEPFKPGKDNCHFCRMAISDTRFGAEVVTSKGKIFKFDDLHCMAGFMQLDENKEKEFSRILAVDFNNPTKFLDVEKAVFIIDPAFKSPMASHAAAFSDRSQVPSEIVNKPPEWLTWTELQKKLSD
jgi:copper chaperone NosL